MISIGVDTGFTTAITWLELIPGQRPRYLGHRTIQVGHKVPLAKVRRFKNGCEQTDETVIDDADIEAFCDEFRRLIYEEIDPPMGWDLLTVERVKKVHPRERFSAHMATCLGHSQWIGAEAAAIGRELLGSAHVRTIARAEWRKALIGDWHRGLETEDQSIAKILPLAVDNWPLRSNPDVRDAGGIAFVGAQVAKEEWRYDEGAR